MDLADLLERHSRTEDDIYLSPENRLGRGGMSVVYKKPSPRGMLALKVEPVGTQEIFAAPEGITPVHVDYLGGGMISIYDNSGDEVKASLDENALRRLQGIIFERQITRLFTGENAPNIMRYAGHEFWRVGPYLCSAMSLVTLERGVTLGKLVLSYINEQGKYKIIHQLGLAVDQLARKNVVHRDIKPDNVLVDPDSLEIKLFDFGISTMNRYQSLPGDQADVEVLLKEKLESKGLFIGTLGFTPADEVKGRSTDFSVDAFSYGMTSAYLLLGSNPFPQNEGTMQLMARMLSYDAEAMKNILQQLSGKGINSDVIKAIEKAIRPNPRRREYQPLLDISGKIARGENPAYDITPLYYQTMDNDVICSSPPPIEEPSRTTIPERPKRRAQFQLADTIFLPVPPHSGSIIMPSP